MSETVTKTDFELMLQKFNRTVENQPKVSEVKETILKLRELAINSKALNSRQTDAITARVDNYLNGTYGVNKKKELFNNEQK